MIYSGTVYYSNYKFKILRRFLRVNNNHISIQSCKTILVYPRTSLMFQVKCDIVLLVLRCYGIDDMYCISTQKPCFCDTVFLGILSILKIHHFMLLRLACVAIFCMMSCRPERWVVSIPSSDQWLATIGNHWKTIATNGFGDQKPLKNHC